MTTEDLETLARLYGCLNTGQADEAAIAEIERIEARYRWGAPG